MVEPLIVLAASPAVCKLLDLAQPIVEAGCKLLGDLLGTPCSIAGEMIGDALYSWQWRNRIRIVHSASEIMRKDSIASKVLPKGFLMPLLKKGGDIEEPSLQAMWAKLLVSGISDEKHQHPSFVRVLSELSAFDAHVLNEVRKISDAYRNGPRADHLIYYDNEAKRLNLDTMKLIMSGRNLIRLGLCGEPMNTHAPTPEDPKPGHFFFLSLYGYAFTDACLTF